MAHVEASGCAVRRAAAPATAGSRGLRAQVQRGQRLVHQQQPRAASQARARSPRAGARRRTSSCGRRSQQACRCPAVAAPASSATRRCARPHALAAEFQVAAHVQVRRTGSPPGTRSRAAGGAWARTRRAHRPARLRRRRDDAAGRGRSSPATQRSSVVLPEPEGPNSAVMPRWPAVRGRRRAEAAAQRCRTRSPAPLIAQSPRVAAPVQQRTAPAAR